MKPEISLTSLSIIERFYSPLTPGEALFPTKEAKVIVPMSNAWWERGRWCGSGIPFVKIGSRVFYRKQDILDFINRHDVAKSTSEIQSGGML